MTKIYSILQVLFGAIVFFSISINFDILNMVFLILSAIGAFIWFYSWITLGKLWNLNIKPKGKIIKKGFYKYFKHPMYIGASIFLFFLWLTSVRVANSIFLCLFFATTYFKAKEEEKFLKI